MNGESQEPPQIVKRRFILGRGGIAVSLVCVVMLVLAGVSLSNVFAQRSVANTSTITPSEISQLNQTTLQHAKVVHHSAVKTTSGIRANVATANDVTTATLPFNNNGTSDDSNGYSANFDGGHHNYSAEALYGSGLYAGQQIMFDGVTFSWPAGALGTSNNVVASGQVVPVTTVANAGVLAFLGSATNGATSGTATMTFTDGTSQQFSLGMSDWTLNGGTAQPSFSNQIATAMMYRDTITNTSTNAVSKQSVKIYLFYANATIPAGKTVQSVTLPSGTKGQIHIFSIGSRAAGASNPYSYTNTGISDQANTSAANFDGGGASYAAQSIANYWVPGDTIYFNGLNFPWPDAFAGQPDNWQGQGQTLPVTKVGDSVGFIGSATGGALADGFTVNYTDGTSQNFSFNETDWTLQGGNALPSQGDFYFLGLNNRDTRGGTQSVSTFFFASFFSLKAGETAQSITLPNDNRLHIFSVGGQQYGEPNNNTSTSIDNYGHFLANFDGSYYSYSQQALQKAGVVVTQEKDYYGNTVNVNHLLSHGIDFAWPYTYDSNPDNTTLQGQEWAVYPVVPNATGLAFIGSSTGGSASGTVTINYTDGSQSTATLGFTDWCASTTSFGNQVAITTAYRNTESGSQNASCHLYYAQIPFTAGKTLKNILLPSNSKMHVFDVEEFSYNNVGISSNSATKLANYDGGGASYSQQALQSAGLTANQNFTFNGVNFTWPNVQIGTGVNDNYQVSGQQIAVTPVTGATTLAFLGSSTNGPSSGTATIIYTDGSTQTFTLNLTDWCVSGGTPITGNQVAATMNQRNTGSGTQTLKNYIFYTDVTLTSGKTIAAVQLPSSVNKGAMHIFAIGTK